MSAERYPPEHVFRNLLSHPQKPDTPADDVPLDVNDLAGYASHFEATTQGQGTDASKKDQSIIYSIPEDFASPNAFLESLFSRSPMGMVLIDETGTVLGANQVFLKMFEYQHHEVFGKKLDELVATSREIRKLMAHIKDIAALAKKKPLIRVSTRERKDGTRMDVLLSTVPFKTNGKYYAYAIYHDVTEKVQAQNDLQKTMARLERTLETTLRTFSKIIEERDPYTAGHQRRVAGIAEMLAGELTLDHETAKTLHVAALLHDIGKIAVPAEILSKPSILSDSEKEIIKIHPSKSFDLVQSMEFPGPVAECVLQHHERLDGSGYPRGLRSGEILPIAQILAVADVFEAMSSHRPYRPSRGFEAALEELKNGSGILYNSQAVDALERLARSGKLKDIMEAID